MESARLFSLLFVVLAAVISVDAGVTPFEEQFLPSGINYIDPTETELLFVPHFAQLYD